MTTAIQKLGGVCRELVRQLGRHRSALVAITACAVVAAVISALLPRTYIGRSVLLPPQQGQGTSQSVLASLGVLAAATGSTAGAKTTEDLYASLLKSNSIADALISMFKLQEHYDLKTLAATRRKLARATTVLPEKKSGLIILEVSASTPELAAQIANTYGDKLTALMSRVAITDARQRREFYEKQTAQARERLIVAEVEAKRVLGKSGVGTAEVEASLAGSLGTQLRAQAVALEVQLRTRQEILAPSNPDIQRLRLELQSVRRQLAEIESGGGTGRLDQDGKQTNEQIAAARAVRELRYSEMVYSSLLQQYQLALADEGKEAPLVQQIDRALPPELPSNPSALLVGLATGASLLMLYLIWLGWQVGSRAPRPVEQTVTNQ